MFFCLFSFFSNNLQHTTVDYSGIWTQIARVDGEIADNLTTTIVQLSKIVWKISHRSQDGSFRNVFCPKVIKPGIISDRQM